MVEVYFGFENIHVSNVNEIDLREIMNWLDQRRFSMVMRGFCTSYEELYDRYLESLLSECEFFLKVKIDRKLCGIIKGTTEFKNPNKTKFYLMSFDDSLISEEKKKILLERLMHYFYDEYGISSYYSYVLQDDSNTLKFWKNNDFQVEDLHKDFINVEDRSYDALVLRR